MRYVEFVVPGVPISNQVPGANLSSWRAAIAAEARSRWNSPPLLVELKAIVINFYAGIRPTLDLDNMSKPILDAMENLVYAADRQIRQAELTHVHIRSPFVFVGASPLIVNAVQAGNQFVYVRIEDPVVPFPLPG
jgi:hypothetical protein